MSFINRCAAFSLSFILLCSAIVMPAWSDSTNVQAPSSRNLVQEERNRQLVVDFYNGVFNRHDVARSAGVLIDGYIQHNPGVPNGKASFVNYFTSFFKSNPNARSRIVRSAADGDLVYLHIHATNGQGDRGLAIVDIFRVENNRIVEHWDVIQKVPAEAANTNTMF